MKKFLLLSFLVLGTWLVAGYILTNQVLAHEVYVLSPDKFSEDLRAPWINVFASLRGPHNFVLAGWISFGVLALLLAGVFFWRSWVGGMVDLWLRRFDGAGHVIVRLALAASLFASAWTGSFLGPDVLLANLPFSEVLRALLFILSLMFLFGIGTEYAAVVSLVLFSLVLMNHGLYLLTYLNYFGELIALLIFGSRVWSLDGLLLGSRGLLARWSDFEPVILRVFFGLALIYTAIHIKLLHPAIALDVVTQYHLTSYTTFFPSDPLLLVLGASVVELLIGLFLVLGFQTRLTIVVMLFYITLSLLFFRESVWPHLMLYGIGISLFLSGGRKWSLDGWINRLKFRG
jgi:uncharacterized membrane protein YphA (DoxX/SURF4 family)